MENGSVVNKEFCVEHNKLIDERFARDKSRLDEQEKRLSGVGDCIKELTICQTQMSELLKRHSDELHEIDGKLSEQEQKPAVIMTKWQTAIISGVVSAIVAIITALIKSLM